MAEERKGTGGHGSSSLLTLKQKSRSYERSAQMDEDSPVKDDVVVDLQGILQSLRARVSRISNQDMVKLANQKVVLIDRIEAEVMKKCSQISNKIEEVRAFISSHTTSAKGAKGCLRGGAIDDYLPSFDQTIAHF